MSGATTGRATTFERLAPAKLNLTLSVTGRRPDSYHLLDSLVAFTDFGDLVEASPAETLSLTVEGPFAGDLAGDGAENLVLRAARLLAAETGTERGAALRLIKLLPVASGIGGGSSDAAATLRALLPLWSVELEEADLMRIGLRLGADVPVCLAAGTARLRGIGEILSAGPTLPPTPVVLVNPGVAVSTPAIFRRLDGRFTPEEAVPRWLSPANDVASLADRLKSYDNDLTSPAIALAPAIGQVLAQLSQTPGCLLARMSGSGATCFGLFADAAAAEHASQYLAQSQPGWWVVATRLRHRPRLMTSQ